jgi:hypothetical protein
MAISSSRAIFGLQAIGTETGPLASGSVTLGAPQTQVNFTDADVCYSTQITLTDDDPVLAVSTGHVTANGATVLDGDGLDFQGNAIPTIATLYGLAIELVSGSAEATDQTNTFPVPCLFWFPSGSTTTELLGNLTITSAASAAVVIVSVIGKTA